MSLPVSYVAQISEEMKYGALFFNMPILANRQMYTHFLRLHAMLTHGQRHFYPMQTETVLMAFISEIFCRNGHHAHQHSSSSRLSSYQVDVIKQQFHQGLVQEFDLETLSASLGLNKFQFLRQFKAATDMTPHAYLTRLRLEYAKKALMRGDSATDTAHSVGFFDQSHFSKAFKRAYLTTPAHFQRRLSA